VEASGSVARVQLCKVRDGCLSETDDGKLHGSGDKRKKEKKKKTNLSRLKKKKTTLFRGDVPNAEDKSRSSDMFH